MSRNGVRRALALVLPLVLGVLQQACSGVGGTGDHVEFVQDCGVTAQNLQGTWQISVKPATLTCAGKTLKTTSAVTSIPGVTATKSGNGFTVAGSGLTAVVDSDTCHITYSFVDSVTHGLFSCFCTFFPATKTIGAGIDDAHCYGAAPDPSKPTIGCDVSPELDSVVTVVN